MIAPYRILVAFAVTSLLGVSSVSATQMTDRTADLSAKHRHEMSALLDSQSKELRALTATHRSQVDDLLRQQLREIIDQSAVSTQTRKACSVSMEDRVDSLEKFYSVPSEPPQDAEDVRIEALDSFYTAVKEEVPSP